MTNENKNLIFIPKDANYIEILGYRIDGFDSFEAFCEYLKKYAELEEIVEHLQAENEDVEKEIDKQYEQARADILENMADGGTSCHWCIEQHKAEAYKEIVKELKERFENLEYNTRTNRKTVKVEELKEQMDWVLHTVAIETIDNLLKEKIGETK